MDFQKYNIKEKKNKKKKKKQNRVTRIIKNNNNIHTHKICIYVAFALKIGSFFLKSDSRL